MKKIIQSLLFVYSIILPINGHSTVLTKSAILTELEKINSSVYRLILQDCNDEYYIRLHRSTMIKNSHKYAEEFDEKSLQKIKESLFTTKKKLKINITYEQLKPDIRCSNNTSSYFVKLLYLNEHATINKTKKSKSLELLPSFNLASLKGKKTLTSSSIPQYDYFSMELKQIYRDINNDPFAIVNFSQEQIAHLEKKRHFLNLYNQSNILRGKKKGIIRHSSHIDKVLLDQTNQLISTFDESNMGSIDMALWEGLLYYFDKIENNSMYNLILPILEEIRSDEQSIIHLHKLINGASRDDSVLREIFKEEFIQKEDIIRGHNSNIIVLTHQESDQKIIVRSIEMDLNSIKCKTSPMHAFYLATQLPEEENIMPNVFGIIPVPTYAEGTFDPRTGFIQALEFSTYYGNGNLRDFFNELHKNNDDHYRTIIEQSISLYTKMARNLIKLISIGIYWTDFKPTNILLDDFMNPFVSDRKAFLLIYKNINKLNIDLYENSGALFIKSSNISHSTSGAYYNDQVVIDTENGDYISIGKLISLNIIYSFMESLTNMKSGIFDIEHEVFNSITARDIDLKIDLKAWMNNYIERDYNISDKELIDSLCILLENKLSLIQKDKSSNPNF